jgi:hypothetical protein
MSSSCLCVNYYIENQNNNRFSSNVFLSPSESVKFLQAFQDKHSKIRKLPITFAAYDPSQHSAVVFNYFAISFQTYEELYTLNERSFIGLDCVYAKLCKELAIIPDTLEEVENEIIDDAMEAALDGNGSDSDGNSDEENTDCEDEEFDENGMDQEITIYDSDDDDDDDDDDSDENQVDDTIHDLVYASNLEELTDLFATGQFTACEPNSFGALPIYMLDCKPEACEKAIAIADLLITYGACLDTAGIGCDEEGNPTQIWLLYEALKFNNLSLAQYLVEMGHPVYNDDIKRGPLFDFTQYFACSM